MLITTLMIQILFLFLTLPFLCHTMKLLELNQFFYLSNRKNICFNKVANCNRQSHFIVLYGAAIWFFIQVIFSSALHFPYVINLVNSILYGTHWYWLALQLLLSAPHQLRWSWKWRNFLWLFISFWWCRNPAFYYHSQNRTSIRVRITCVEILLNQRNSWIPSKLC